MLLVTVHELRETLANDSGFVTFSGCDWLCTTGETATASQIEPVYCLTWMLYKHVIEK